MNNTPATCPTCGQEIKSPTVYDRLRSYRGTMSQADAAVLAHVSRVTWTRIESGVKTEWPQWWSVLSLAGIDRKDAMVAWTEAKPQKGGTADPDMLATDAAQYYENPAPPLDPPVVVNVLPDVPETIHPPRAVTLPKKPWGTIHAETARAIKAREEAREAAEKAGQT